MLKFKDVTIQNFMSFGNVPVTFNLERYHTSIIIGENRDVGPEGESSNGAGKSNIFQAVFWCLFGEGISNIRADGFVNLANKKGTRVTVRVDINGVEYEFTRARKPSTVEIKMNGQVQTPARAVDDEIRDIINFTPEIFLNTYVLDANVEPFMAKKPAAQRDFMEKLLELDILSKRAERLKSLAKDNDAELKIEENSLSIARNYNDKMKAQVASLRENSERWDRDHRNKLTALTQQIEQLQAIDFNKHVDLSEELEGIESELIALARIIDSKRHEISRLDDKIKAKREAEERLAQAQAQHDEWESNKAAEKARIAARLEELEATDWNAILAERQELSTQLNEKTSALNTTLRELDVLEQTISTAQRDLERENVRLASLLAGKCNECGQDYHDKEKVESIQEKVESLKSVIADKTQIIENDFTKAEQLQQEIAAIEARLNDLVSEIDCEKNIGEIEKLRNTTLDINPYSYMITQALTEYEEYKDSNFEAEQEALRKELEDNEKKRDNLQGRKRAIKEEMPNLMSIKEVELKLETLEKYIKDKEAEENSKNPYQDQIDVVSKDIREVDDTKLKELEKRKEHYKVLVKLLTDSKSFIRRNLIDQYVPFINAKLNTYLAELGSPHVVTINDDLTTDISYMTDSIDYGNLSKGERLRLNFATNMAFRDICAAFGKAANIMFVDEYFDSGGDMTFFNSAFKLVSKEPETAVFIISHRDDLKMMADETVKVVKEKGFSTIVEKAA